LAGWRKKAFCHPRAAYDSAIAATLAGNRLRRKRIFKLPQGQTHPPGGLAWSLRKVMDPALRARTPHQSAALYSGWLGRGRGQREAVAGPKELSFKTTSSICRPAWDLAQEFTETVCAIIKHTHQPLRNRAGREPEKDAYLPRPGSGPGIGIWRA